jgi:hypothetical protein
MYLCYFFTNLLTFSFIQGSIHVSDHCFRTFDYAPQWPIFPIGCNNMIHIIANLQNFHDAYHFISQLWNSLRWFSAWSFANLLLPIERLYIFIKDIKFLKCDPANNLTAGDLMMCLSTVGAFGSRNDSCKWS